MFDTPIILFDGENEDELIAEFVELSALYPDHEPYQITEHIFKDRKDPVLRGAQAAMQWSKDLAIKERIRLQKLRGGVEDEIDSKKAKLKVLESIYNSPATAARDRIAAIELHAKMQSEIAKAIELNTNERRVPPQIVSAIGDFYARPD